MKKKINRNWNKFWGITKPFTYKGMLYLDDRYIPVKNEITDMVKWLDEITIYDWSEEDAIIKAFKYFNDKYIEYKGYIWLF